MPSVWRPNDGIHTRIDEASFILWLVTLSMNSAQDRLCVCTDWCGFHLLRTCRLAVFLQQSEMAWMPRTNFPLTNRHEPRHDKTCLREFPTMSDSNWPAQLHVQKLACGLKFWLQKQETLHYQGSEQQRRWSDCAGFGYDIRHVFHGPAHIDFPSLIITSSRRLVSCSGGFW